MGSCRYFFCLMHVGTRYQHYQRGTPDTFSRLRNFSGSHDLDYQRLPACHCHLFAFILVTGRNLWIPQNISFGNSYVHRHFPDLRFVPFILDIDHCPHFPGIQCFGHYQRQHGSVTYDLPPKTNRPGNGDQCHGSGHIGSSRPLGSQRNSICRFLALAIRYQRPSRISCPDFGIKVPAPKRGTFKQTIRQAECHSQCNHLRTPDLYFGWICPP